VFRRTGASVRLRPPAIRAVESVRNDNAVEVCQTLTMLTLNSVAPDFELPDEHGTNVHLQDLRGQWVLLWWYPKAATPG
jgi:cytochrome oxidase Cu insertion factor (SCO1/SenC/PrrC family)